jgi:hypothetical protein
MADARGQFCPEHQAEADYQRNKRPPAAQRGYGPGHQAERARRVARYRPGDECAIGGEALVVPAEYLDLAHDHVNGGYLPGLACRFHNRSQGNPAKKAR